jgi:hypothetical protein
VNHAPGQVPTLSEWGVIALSLMLLAVGTIAWSRRPSTAVGS